MSSAPRDCSDAHSVSRSFLWDIHSVTSSHLCRKGGDIFQQHHLVAVLKSRAWIPAGLSYLLHEALDNLTGKEPSYVKGRENPYLVVPLRKENTVVVYNVGEEVTCTHKVYIAFLTSKAHGKKNQI